MLNSSLATMTAFAPLFAVPTKLPIVVVMMIMVVAMMLIGVDAEHTCMHNHLLKTHPPLQPHLHRTEQSYSNEVRLSKEK